MSTPITLLPKDPASFTTIELKVRNSVLKLYFQKILNEMIDPADLNIKIEEGLSAPFTEHLENTNFINLSIFMLTSLYSWELVRKVLEHEGAKKISQGNLIHTLWAAIHADNIDIVQTIAKYNYSKGESSLLRDHDLMGLSTYLANKGTPCKDLANPSPLLPPLKSSIRLLRFKQELV